MNRTRALAFPATAFLVAVLAGCSAPPSAVTPTSDTQYLAMNLQEARTNGQPDADQLRVLEDAVKSGVVSWDDYQSAVFATIACLQDAGIPHNGPTAVQSQGILILQYSAETGPPSGGVYVTSSPAGADGIEHATPTPEQLEGNVGDPLFYVADACRMTHSAFVESAYMEQPTSLAALDAFFESKRDSVTSCATDLGLAVDPEDSMVSILSRLVDLGEDGQQCLYVNDISWF